MRVLVAHNRYRSDQPSGENVVVDAEIAALRDAGVDVVAWLPSSDEIDLRSPRGLLEAAAGPMRAPWGAGTFTRLLAEHRPDVVHLHNVYPLVGPQVVKQAHDAGVPVVMTVHNFRLTCMAGSHFRDSLPCTQCTAAGNPLAGVQHACYRNSRLQSLPMAASLSRRPLSHVDRFIAPSRFMADYVTSTGVAESRVTIRPHWVADLPQPAVEQSREGAVYVGRLAPEKGVELLAQAWNRLTTSQTLTFFGGGPLHDPLRAKQSATMRVAGRTEATAIQAAMARARVVVVPSLFDEPFGLVAAEALRAGTPVLASTRGALPEVVGDAGWIVEPTVTAIAHGLSEALVEDRPDLNALARSRFEERYAQDVLVDQQIDIYQSVIEQA